MPFPKKNRKFKTKFEFDPSKVTDAGRKGTEPNRDPVVGAALARKAQFSIPNTSPAEGKFLESKGFSESAQATVKRVRSGGKLPKTKRPRRKKG